MVCVNPLNAELNPICYLLALVGAHPILNVSRIRVKLVLWDVYCVNGCGSFWLGYVGVGSHIYSCVFDVSTSYISSV